MSGHEILTRLTESCSTLRERFGLLPRRAAEVSRDSTAEDQALLTRARTLLPGCRPDQIRSLEQVDPVLLNSLRERVANRTADLFAGRWKSLGFPFQLQSQVNWHLDPVSGHAWPRKFYSDLELYGLSNGADVKFTWEMSRHQFLFELAANWTLNGDGQSAERARGLLLDWIRDNPALVGVNWTSALECAMRIIAWLWTLSAMADWGHWQSGDLATIRSSLLDHAGYLTRHLSHYSSPYNHLIGEATGLYLVGCWLTGTEADNCRKRAKQVFRDHARRQFTPDGFTVEQASGYHYYTLGFLTLAREASRNFDDELSPLDELLSQAWRTGALLHQPDGRWSQFGDLDSARALPVLPADYWDFRSLLSLGAVNYGDPVVAAAAGCPGEELFWLRGCDGVRRFLQLKSEQATIPCGFLPHAGYSIGRSAQHPGDWMLFDCGPISDGLFADSTPSTAHGHADLLQVLLFQNHQPILIDSGMDTYAGDISRVDWFRDTAAHNTVAVAGAPPVRPAGRLAWSNAVPVGPLRGLLNDDFWMVVGGYTSPEGVAVERSVFVVPGDGAWIADLVKSESRRRVTWTWHPGNPSSLDSIRPIDCGFELPWGQTTMRMQSSGQPIRAEVTTSAPGAPDGWKCHGYGEREPGALVRAEIESSPPVTLMLTGFTTTRSIAAVRTSDGTTSVGWPDTLPTLPERPVVEWTVQTPTATWWLVLGSARPTGTDHSWTECPGTGSDRVWRALL